MDAFEWLHDVWINGQEMNDYCILKARLFYKACDALKAIYLNLGEIEE